MAKGLIRYGGVATKIRAMQNRCLKPDDYRALTKMSSPIDVVTFLKNFPGYQDIFKNVDENTIHRGDIELLIETAIYDDYMKIYRFVDNTKRKFLEIYFTKFEIYILITLIRKIFDEQYIDHDLSFFKSFFESHSSFDFNKVSKSKNINEFLENLEGSEFKEVLSGISDEIQNLFSYEMKLENYYYNKLWKLKDKHLKGKDYELIEEIIGQRIDIENVLWIFRNKKYYDIDSSIIYAYVIPINYKLTKKQLLSLVEANSVAEFMLLIDKTYYKGLFDDLVEMTNEKMSIDTQVNAYLYKKTADLARNNPFSIAAIVNYLTAKEIEISDIISIIEGVRYKLSPEKLEQYVIKYKL